ncbi:MAG: hypothetical protein GY943_26045 [Chloroflexi bacterium]|nr:hypothetical protein [Chloroflexota bacterium]
MLHLKIHLWGDADAVIIGRDLYNEHNCYHSHGSSLNGNGNFSPGLKPRSVNLTGPALMSLPFMTDSYLYWRIGEGGAAPQSFISPGTDMLFGLDTATGKDVWRYAIEN